MSVSARQRVLRALQAAGTTGCTTAHLCQPEVGGERFGARVMELRAEGHKIDSRRLREGSWLYAYVGHNGAAPAEGGTPRTPTRAPLPSIRPILPTFHVCDHCGYRFKGSAWPQDCPSCQAFPHWLCSFHEKSHAIDYVPLCHRTPTAAAA